MVSGTAAADDRGANIPPITNDIAVSPDALSAAAAVAAVSAAAFAAAVHTSVCAAARANITISISQELFNLLKLL